jgi:hypothetical protein
MFVYVPYACMYLLYAPTEEYIRLWFALYFCFYRIITMQLLRKDWELGFWDWDLGLVGVGSWELGGVGTDRDLRLRLRLWHREFTTYIHFHFPFISSPLRYLASLPSEIECFVVFFQFSHTTSLSGNSSRSLCVITLYILHSLSNIKYLLCWGRNLTFYEGMNNEVKGHCHCRLKSKSHGP